MTKDVRSLLDDADDAPKVPTEVGEIQKKAPESEEDKVPPTDKEDEGRGKEVSDEDELLEDEDEEEDDEDEDDEIELDKKPIKEPSTLTKLKKEPGVKEILKKYPEVEDNFFEARRYRQVFATVDQAKVASEKSELLDDVIGHLMNGDIGYLFDQLHETDPQVVPVLINNFLPTVHGKSRELFNSIVTPLMTNMLARIAKDAQKTNDEDLLTAVRYINRHISGDSGVPGFKKIENLSRRSEDATKVEQEGQLATENLFYDSVEELMMPQLDAEINKGLDPDNVLTKNMRATLIKVTKTRILKKLGTNDEHMQTMTALKRAARAANFSKEYKRKIARVSLNAALELVPSVRARVKKKMFGNMFEKSERTEGIDPGASGSNPRTVGSSTASLPFNPEKIDWSRTNLRDALDADVSKVVLKK